MEGRVEEAGQTGEEGQRGVDATSGGVVYTAWGLSECPPTDNTLPLLQGGLMSGSPKTKSSAGANYLCLPPDPTFSDLANPGATTISHIAGVVYSTVGEPLEASHGDAVPCSVCFARQAVQLMIPGQAVCPGERWRMEYNGYLMSARDTEGPLSTEESANFRFRTEYVCVSSETVGVEVSGSSGGDDELYHVHLDCDTGSSLDCSARGLSSDLQLTCALCTLNTA